MTYTKICSKISHYTEDAANVFNHAAFHPVFSRKLVEAWEQG